MNTNSQITACHFDMTIINHFKQTKSQTISRPTTTPSTIDVETLLSSIDIHNATILPSISFNDNEDLAEEHDAQPIKNIQDIINIRNYFISNHQYRNNMLFTIGINTGLRCSDLLKLKFGTFLKSNSEFYDEIVVLEQKTSTTRGRKKTTDEDGIETIICKPRNRHIFVNDAIKLAISLYLKYNRNTAQDDYMFRSESNNSKHLKSNEPITRQSVQNILTKAVTDLHLNLRSGSHILRKTFSYHIIVGAKDRNRALELLQQLLGHSNITTTLRYAGLSSDEYKNAYVNLNLGYKDVFDCSSTRQYIA